MTGPGAKEQDNDGDEKPVNKSVKTLGKRLWPIARQPAKVEEIKPVSTTANRRNAKREAKNPPVEEGKVMPATEKKGKQGRKAVDHEKYIADCTLKIEKLGEVLKDCKPGSDEYKKIYG